MADKSRGQLPPFPVRRCDSAGPACHNAWAATLLVAPATPPVLQVSALLNSLISAALRPLVRILVGLIAIPLFRLFAQRFMRWDKFNAELTKDIEQWVRGSLLLLLATANVETALVDSVRGWIPTPAPSEQFNVEELLDSHSGKIGRAHV